MDWQHLKNSLYVSHRGKITRVCLQASEREDLIAGLPSLGDQQNNDVLLHQDGSIYLGQGTATKAGVVG